MRLIAQVHREALYALYFFVLVGLPQPILRWQQAQIKFIFQVRLNIAIAELPCL